ncbi:MAG: vitamin B12 dependent-methionine synthase activation domain-containing protein [Acidimicrobiia bacterium]
MIEAVTMVMSPAPAYVRSATISAANPTIEPPFLGAHVVGPVRPDEIVGYLDEDALFGARWHLSPGAGESESAFRRSARRLLVEQLAAAAKQEIFAPQVAYGYFPANSDGNEVIIWDDEMSSERARLVFKRQSGQPRLCVADYVKPVGQIDYVALQMVTMGNRMSRRSPDHYGGATPESYLRLHGLGIAMEDALTEYWHRRIRIEWGFWDEDGPSLGLVFRQFYRGGRYPVPGNEHTVAELLGAERIGVTVGGAGDDPLQPELTTVRLIVHHPQAGGFVID